MSSSKSTPLGSQLFVSLTSPVCMLRCFSRVQLFATPWTVAWQAALSMGFSRQEYWSGLPFSPPGDLPDPGLKPTSPLLLHWEAGFTTDGLGRPRVSLKSCPNSSKVIGCFSVKTRTSQLLLLSNLTLYA